MQTVLVDIFFLNFFDKSFCCLNIISYFCDVI